MIILPLKELIHPQLIYNVIKRNSEIKKGAASTMKQS